MNALYYDPVAGVIVEPLAGSIDDVLQERLCPCVADPTSDEQLTVWFTGNQSKLVCPPTGLRRVGGWRMHAGSTSGSNCERLLDPLLASHDVQITGPFPLSNALCAPWLALSRHTQIRYWKFRLRGLSSAEARIHSYLMARADDNATWEEPPGVVRDVMIFGVKVHPLLCMPRRAMKGCPRLSLAYAAISSGLPPLSTLLLVQFGVLNRISSTHPSVATLWRNFECLITSDKNSQFWHARIASLGV